LKCGAGEGWKRSVGPMVREMKKYYIKKRRKKKTKKKKKRKEGKLEWPHFG
jgi:hypothetical protein